MTLDASGNLGVGETSPNSQLTIKKSASGALGPNIILNNSGGGFSDQTALTFQSSGTTRGQILSNVDGGAGGSGSLQFWTLSNNGATFSEKMRVDSSGNLLVGTTTSPTNVRAGNKYQSLGGATIEGGPVANISISTSAVQLTRSSGTGGFAMITGYNTGNGDQGTWFVSWSSSRGATIISAQLPVGIVLTFTVTSGALFAATVSGTFLATIFAMSA